MEFMATQPDGAFDLAIVDPPYGRGEDGGTNRCSNVKQKNGNVLRCMDGGYTKKDWDREPPTPEYFSELRRIAKHQIVWGMNYMPVLLRGGAIVWDKVNDGSDQSGAEIAYCSLNQRVDVVRYMWRGMMQGESVGSLRQQGNKALNERRIHPTQKPVKLYEWLLRQYAQPGMKILDTHLGSGSAAIAAHYYGVDFVGCEIDVDYWRAAKERFKAETLQMALLAPNR
jgi:site-specific DNA-methyltransferase (adenine-specific)